MSIYAEIVNDLTSSGVGFRMTQVGSVEDSIMESLLFMGAVWEARGTDSCRVYYRECRRKPRAQVSKLEGESEVYLHP